MPSKWEQTGPNSNMESAEERGKSAEKLKNLESQISERLNGEGVPVDDDCRIRMDVFDGVYPAEHIKKDRELTETRKIKYLEEKTDYEKNLFSYFIASIDLQIKTLKLYPRLNWVLKNSIATKSHYCSLDQDTSTCHIP